MPITLTCLLVTFHCNLELLQNVTGIYCPWDEQIQNRRGSCGLQEETLVEHNKYSGACALKKKFKASSSVKAAIME